MGEKMSEVKLETKKITPIILTVAIFILILGITFVILATTLGQSGTWDLSISYPMYLSGIILIVIGGLANTIYIIIILIKKEKEEKEG